MRELEQCVRNVLVRKRYVPTAASNQEAHTHGARGQFLRQVMAGTLSADEVLNRYCTLVYHREITYEGTGERLGLDRRTVKARLDAQFLRALQAQSK